MEMELSIQGVGFPPLSARGCRQKLWTTGGEYHRRTIGGHLVFTGGTFKKYKTVIEGEDQTVLTTDGVLLPGVSVHVECIQRLWQVIPHSMPKVTLARSPVEGSIFHHGDFQTEGSTVNVTPHDHNRFLSYRPRLSMMVIRYELITHEWDFKTKWVLEMEEV